MSHRTKLRSPVYQPSQNDHAPTCPGCWDLCPDGASYCGACGKRLLTPAVYSLIRREPAPVTLHELSRQTGVVA